MEKYLTTVKFNVLNTSTQDAVTEMLHKATASHSQLSWTKTEIHEALGTFNPDIAFGTDADGDHCFRIADGLKPIVLFLEGLDHFPADEYTG